MSGYLPDVSSYTVLLSFGIYLFIEFMGMAIAGRSETQPLCWRYTTECTPSIAL